MDFSFIGSDRRTSAYLYLKTPTSEMEVHTASRMWKSPGLNYSENDKGGAKEEDGPQVGFLCFLHLLRENQYSYLNTFQEMTLGNIRMWVSGTLTLSSPLLQNIPGFTLQLYTPRSQQRWNAVWLTEKCCSWGKRDAFSSRGRPGSRPSASLKGRPSSSSPAPEYS